MLGSVNTYGGLTLLQDQMGLLAGTGERRFFVGDYPELSADGVESYYNPMSDWAVGVGVWGEPNSSQRRLFQPRIVECGNGIVQAAEECDDANMIVGDGCDACVWETGGTDSGTGGDVGLGGGNGCECRAHDRGQGWLGFLSMFGTLGLALRARRRRSGRAGQGQRCRAWTGGARGP
ncbi:hypothetical protein ENSA7_81800 [Enhygromyxa salina]|uniref:Uncharacterized protein n=1 Tax=Enhygromyxa salina TaxID=215803 RepID=A0A2S9XGD9_9BACT|nr:hypothetical protein ENSA7_81800 [Enhygromyxa salina]